MVPEQRDQQNDRNWHADQPKQNTSTETHVDLQLVSSGESCAVNSFHAERFHGNSRERVNMRRR
jgi:hypothetical protein